MNTKEKYRIFLDNLEKDDPMYEELLSIKENPDEITDRFYKDIEFGTAGLRGICGAGTNRMNRLTVGRAIEGTARFIERSGYDKNAGAVIAFDCRYHSKEFSFLAAGILAAHGIHVYIFPTLRPTPELSFLVRKLHAVTGINMTASHNPKQYNGCKIYQSDGAQISGKISDGISKEINSLSLFEKWPHMDPDEAEKKGLLTVLGEKEDQMYLDYVLSKRFRAPDELDLSTPVVYTPLNGAGSIPMRKAAEARGFSNFITVPEQRDPDPDFTSVPYPNPENPKAFLLAEKLGKEKNAELLIATDPDSDRMAAEISDGRGGYTALDGNQTGALIINYMAESMKKNGTMPPHPVMIKSIVTGDLGRKICESYGISVFEALTGFKNICGRVPELESKGYNFFFAYEESIGCAPGEEVRDKDGICAGMIMCEMAAWCRHRGIHLRDYLESVYEKYGWYSEDQVSLVFEGEEGEKKIRNIMSSFRNEDYVIPNVSGKTDYINGYKDIPPQNALKFTLNDGSWFALRPSGTEPKIKFYFYTKAGNRRDSEQALSSLRDLVMNLVK